MTYETYRIYTRVLKFGQKIGVRRFFETVLFGITIFAITLVYFFVLTWSEESVNAFSPAGKYIFFPIGLFVEIALILSYIEAHYHLDIFGENTNKFLAIIGVTSLIVIVLYATIPALYLSRTISGSNISLIVLFFLLGVIETAYFLYSTPRVTRSEVFGLEYQFSQLEEKLKAKKLGDLPIEKAFAKGITALKKRVNEEGYWGEINPVYETATVLEFFHSIGYNLDTEWIMATKEGTVPVTLRKPLENLSAIVETLETLEMSYEQFYVMYSVSLFDPTIFDKRMAEIEEFRNSIFEDTEWDFINKLNRFTPNLRSRTTPLHITMSYVADVTGNIKLLDKLASLFSACIEIVVKRGYARFSTSQTGKTPIEMFARLMLALHDIRRAPTKRQQFTQAIGGTHDWINLEVFQ
ncbi:MAG: hypothetical protein KGD64_06350, partial [Candidatus Heimdallarchaeota archaeon]|nr:hypothetical protein [Candidatus Heimdallarchaeota archaeon]